MPDISSLSDDELQKLLAQPHQSSLKSMSDDDLRRLLGPGSMTAGEQLGDLAKSGGIGLAQGTIAIPGMPGDIQRLSQQGGEWLGNKMGIAPISDEIKQRREQTNLPTSADIQHAVEGVTGKFYEPKTVGGQYLRTIGGMAPASLFGGGGWASNLLRYGVAPAVVSESAARLPGVQGSSIEPWVRGGTALATGGLASLVRPGNAETVLAPALQGLDRPTLDAAQALMRDAAAQGMNLSWAQAIERAGSGHVPLQRLQRYVERTQQGQPAFTEFYEGQPEAMRQAATGQFNNIAPPAANPYAVGPEAAQAATGAINDVRRTLNQGTEHLYRGSAHHLVAGANTNSPAFQSVRNQILRDDILPQSVPGVAAPLQNFPPHSVASINMVQQRGREIAENLRTHEGGNNRYKASLIDQQIDDAVRAARAQSPDYDQAMRVQAQIRADTLDPLQQGPLGGVANSTSTEQASKALLGRNLAGGERQVARAVANMDANTPGAGSALVRQHLADSYDTAARSLVGGPNYYGGAKFAKDVAGTPQLEADLSSAARASTGGPPADAGLQRLIEVLRATGRRLPEGSQTATDLGMKDVMDAARGPIERTASYVSRPLSAVGRAVDEGYGTYRAGATSRELARVLQDPNEIELLSRLARAQRRGNTSAALLANALRASQETQQPSYQ